MARSLLPLVLGFALGSFACATRPAPDAKTADAPARKPVEYVPVGAWQSPPAAKRSEDEVAAEPQRPGGYVDLPKLTRHQDIPTGSARRLGRVVR